MQKTAAAMIAVDCLVSHFAFFIYENSGDLLAVILFFSDLYGYERHDCRDSRSFGSRCFAGGLYLWKFKKLDTMQWVGLVLIVVFGGATILLKDPRFIMWKPTVLF